MVLCTYTDKATNEMRSRFMKLAQDVGYQGDLSQLRVGTIHSICNQLITEYRHLTALGNDYTVLDEFAQTFFIFQHLDIIDRDHYFSNKWEKPKWEIAKRLKEYFDKIMEELIKQKRLIEDTDPFFIILVSHIAPDDIDTMKENAQIQVWNYVRQNLMEMQHILEIEVDVTIEKDGYILTGRIDVLRERNDILELLDFKTDYRLEPDATKLIDYERQLCIYASALEKRYNKRPEQLILYWTKEQHREDAIMSFRYSSEMVERVGRSIDGIVANIKERKFAVLMKPEQTTCKSCDLQHTCINDKTIEPFTI